jgi:hypothetical protein
MSSQFKRISLTVALTAEVGLANWKTAAVNPTAALKCGVSVSLQTFFGFNFL